MDTLYCGLSPKSPNLFPLFTWNETFIKRTPKSTWNGHFYCCQNFTTQHARHRKCECHPQFFRFLQNVTWRTYLISLTVKYCFLFRFICIDGLFHSSEFFKCGETFIYRENCLHKKAWVALGKSFHLCRLKNHKNSKLQPKKKTFSLIEEGRISGS